MLRSLMIAVAVAGLSCSPVLAKSPANPIFGGGTVKVMTANDMQKTVAKGPTADYYGYYGDVNAYNALYWSYYGYYYSDYGSESYYYANATNSAYYAYLNYYNAYYYAGF